MIRPVAHTYKRPSVVAKAEAVRLCGICLGAVRDGLPYALCDCGKLYHVSCAFRVGTCVSCGIAMEERMRVEPEAASEADGDAQPAIPFAGAAPRTAVKAPHSQAQQPPAVVKRGERGRLSPDEKLELLEERLLTAHISEATYHRLREKYEREVSEAGTPDEVSATADEAEGAGGITAPDAGENPSTEAEEPSIQCPECGAAVREDAPSCPKCGVRFVEDGQFSCPECRRALDASARECECGAVFTDSDTEEICPVCGAVQEAGSARCRSCGVEFSDDAEDVEYRCPECDRVIAEDALICDCGAVFDRDMGEGTLLQCPECGAGVAKDDAFCPGCGAQFTE